MVYVGQVSGLVENFNTGIYSDTINVINLKLCMMVLLIELYLFVEQFQQEILCSYPVETL